MSALMHFDHINNNVDLSKITLKNPLPLIRYFDSHTPEGGFLFNTSLHQASFLTICPNKLVFMEEYRLYHYIVDNAKFGYVYLIEGTHKGVSRYKIGKANSIKERLSRFEVKIPFDVDLFFSFRVKNALAFEAELHRHFSKKRLSGEWFDLSISDLQELLILGMSKETHDYNSELTSFIEQRRAERKRSKWVNDREYIRYLESVLVFNKIEFENRV